MSGIYGFDDDIRSSSFGVATHSAFSSRQVRCPAGLWVEKSQGKLEQLIQLPKGWDGYDAVSVSFQNAAFALNVLSVICSDESPPPQIVPGVAGDLQLEWHLNSGSIELHIIGPNKVQAWRELLTDDNVEEELQLTTEFSKVADWLADLMEVESAAIRPAA